MRHLLAVVVLLGGCAPAVTVPATDAPPVPSAGLAVPTAATPTLSRSPSPSPSPSSRPPLAATVPPAATASPRPTPGPVRNEGQILLADLSPGRSEFTGEAGPAPAVTTGSHWTLDGTALDGADVRCVRRDAQAGLCTAVRIITDLVRLENGQRYELALDGEAVGNFVATGLRGATPHVVSISATQHELTVVFDRPMLHAGDCGVDGWSFATHGTIEHVRGALGFPAPPGSYTSSSPAYTAFLTAFISQAKVSPDCTTVSFGSGWGGPIGTFDVAVEGVLDLDGNPVEPRTTTVTIADEGPPKLMFAQLELQTADRKVIRVAYSEAMDERTVTEAGRYRLNGKPLPAGTSLACELAGCTWVRLTFPPTAFAYGADNVLTTTDVRDMAGNTISPSPATSGTFQVR